MPALSVYMVVCGHKMCVCVQDRKVDRCRQDDLEPF